CGPWSARRSPTGHSVESTGCGVSSATVWATWPNTPTRYSPASGSAGPLASNSNLSKRFGMIPPVEAEPKLPLDDLVRGACPSRPTCCPADCGGADRAASQWVLAFRPEMKESVVDRQRAV